jgi:predicted ABC-type ATPase
MPNLFILAGPNGAGKSTSAPSILTGARRVEEFVNADVIAKDQGLSDLAAGRQTLAKLEALAAAGRDIAFETTLASRMLLPRIRAMQADGYAFHLTFFWLPNADMAVERVAKRVASGGHSIPKDVIRRRYERGLENFFNAYSAVADAWVLMNNTTRPGRPVAWRRIGAGIEVQDNVLWNQLVARYMRPPRAEQLQTAVRNAGEIARLREVFDPEEIVECVNRAVTEAYKRHKERGESIVIWRDGKIVTLGPDEIEI